MTALSSDSSSSPASQSLAHPGSFAEHFQTVPLDPDTTMGDLLARCADFAETHAALIAKAHVFYPRSRRAEVEALVETVDFPVLWTESASDQPESGGIFVHAISGGHATTLQLRGRPVGLAFGDEAADYCLLTGLRGTGGTEAEQTEAAFHDVEQLLESQDMVYRDVVRTWFYNRDILDWYAEFNAVRTRYYQKHGVFEHLLPASTGIGARNPFDSALMIALFAVKPKGDSTLVREVVSPLQGPATAYGSSFARAVALDHPNHRRLTISGTASIDLSGATVYKGDFEKQVAKTFEVVEAILEAEGFGWQNVVRGVAYYRNESDRMRVDLPPTAATFPLIHAVNTVCRDDLLFELEINAVRSMTTDEK